MEKGAPSIRQHRYAFLCGVAVAFLLHAFLGIALASALRDGSRSRPVRPAVSVDIRLISPEPAQVGSDALAVARDERAHIIHHLKTHKRTQSMRSSGTLAASAASGTKLDSGATKNDLNSDESDVAVDSGSIATTSNETLEQGSASSSASAGSSASARSVSMDDQSVATWPTVKSKPEAYYPEVARRLGIGGRVEMEIGIDCYGNVKSVRVVEVSTDGEKQPDDYGMGEAATRGMWKASFTPARLANGEPIGLVVSYALVFQPSLR